MNATVAQSKPKLPGLINLVLISVLGVSLAKLMWLVITPEQNINTQIQQVNQTNIATKQKVNYGKLIANQHLFGQVKKVVAPPAPTPTAQPAVKAPAPVNLNLKLHGIVAYKTKAKDGFALISLNNGPQKVFSKGQELEEGKGVFVVEILPEKVVLDNNGKEEELILPRKEPRGKNQNTPSPRSNTPSFGNAVAPPPTFKRQRRGAGQINLANFRQQVMSDRTKLLDVASTSPAVVNSRFIGFRLHPGRKPQLFRQFGFRPNDIVTEVNGIVLDDITKGAIVLGELAEASEISIKIKRGNQELYIQRSF